MPLNGRRVCRRPLSKKKINEGYVGRKNRKALRTTDLIPMSPFRSSIQWYRQGLRHPNSHGSLARTRPAR